MTVLELRKHLAVLGFFLVFISTGIRIVLGIYWEMNLFMKFSFTKLFQIKKNPNECASPNICVISILKTRMPLPMLPKVTQKNLPLLKRCFEEASSALEEVRAQLEEQKVILQRLAEAEAAASKSEKEAQVCSLVFFKFTQFFNVSIQIGCFG